MLGAYDHILDKNDGRKGRNRLYDKHDRILDQSARIKFHKGVDDSSLDELSLDERTAFWIMHGGHDEPQ